MRKREITREVRDQAATAVRTYPQKRENLRLLRENLAELRQTESVLKRRVDAAERARLRTTCAQCELQIKLAEAELKPLERALDALDSEERMVVEQMLIAPIRDAAGELAEQLCVEIATVYRRRKRALEKIAMYL
ncbi:MAG: hypothetical protein IKU55_03190 [Clostridia bacterium]|nr:hypothetical protein [Clostridia bacterium]